MQGDPIWLSIDQLKGNGEDVAISLCFEKNLLWYTYIVVILQLYIKEGNMRICASYLIHNT